MTGVQTCALPILNTHESVTPLYLNINIAFESVFVKIIFVSFHTFSLPFALFSVIQRSADFCTCRHFLFRYHQGKVSVCIFCAKDHSFTEYTGKFGWFQVCDYHNPLTYHFFCTVVCFDSGYDLTHLVEGLEAVGGSANVFVHTSAGVVALSVVEYKPNEEE